MLSFKPIYLSIALFQQLRLEHRENFVVNINWDDIDTVLLDMDGTLLDLNFDTYFWMTHLPKRFCEIHGGDIDQVRMNLHRKIMSKKGDQLWYDLTFWSDELNVDIATLKQEVAHLIKPLPNTLRFLEKMHALNKTCHIVTNAHQHSVDIKMEQYDLRMHFARVVIAFEYNHPKENPQFWPLLQNDLQYDPARTLFADDNQDVVLMAEQSGIAQVIGLTCPDSIGTLVDMSKVKKSARTLGDLL